MPRDRKATATHKDMYARKRVAMPDGYYSGDKPNPNLRAFVDAHVKDRPYDPEHDDYNVPAFNKPIETTKANAIYNMHTYWSKKPYDAIRQYIRHYTQPGDLVLDPMCGSGGTALAALMEGRKAIAIDRSPAATFITKHYCTPADPDELRAAFEELRHKVKSEIDWLYETRCDRCAGKATTAYTVYSQVFQCPRCLEKIPLFDCVEAESKTAKGKPKKVKLCPHCHRKGHREVIGSQSEKFGSIPVLVSYLCESGCKPARGERRHDDPSKKKREYFERFDLGKLREIERKEIPHWYPPQRMMNVEDDVTPWGDKWRAGTSSFRTVADLFTKRNLWALAGVREAIGTIDIADLLVLLTWASLKCSRMMRFCEDSIGRILAGTYYVPQIGRDSNVFAYVQEALGDVIAHHVAKQQELPRGPLEVMISTEDARTLPEVPGNSLDYIFTDPPYSHKEQYGELNFVWEAWLGLDTHWHGDEIIVNETRERTEADWAAMVRQAMAECFRVLKPGRWLSLCYHDTSEGTWGLIQDIMAEVGFVVDTSDSALFIDTTQKTHNQIHADKVTKRDLVINFRKPNPLGIDTPGGGGSTTSATFAERARAVIRDFLLALPGSTKDRIYDEVVSRMVRAGRMEAHNFEELLQQVADEIREPRKKNLFENEDPNLFRTHEIGRWYLKETETDVVDTAESAKEDEAAEVISRFMRQHLKKNPAADGVHYSDLFEHYLYAISLADKPRRHIGDWLLDYFYKTESGTYRLPVSEDEERLKTENRVQGTNRRIKRYVAYLQQGLAVPEKEQPSDATLAEWIRHCKRSGLYEQGKLLYDRGGMQLDALPEEVMANVEEDYQVCVRALAQAAGAQLKGKRARKDRQT